MRVHYSPPRERKKPHSARVPCSVRCEAFFFLAEASSALSFSRIASTDTPSCGTDAVPTTSSAIILSPYWVEFVLLNGNRPKHRGGSPCLRRSTYESLN